MSRGIMTVGEDMTFDEIDQLGQIPGLVTSLDQPTAQTAVAQSPMLPGASSTPNLLTSITSILQSGAQAYGAYATSQASKAAAKRPALPGMPINYGTSVAPTSAGMSGTTLALIIGGGVLVLGVGALLIFKK